MVLRLSSLAIRLTLPTALIGMTALGAASPAQAEPEAERPQLQLSVPGRVVTTGGGSKSVELTIVNTGTTPATGLVLDFGTAAAPVKAAIGFKPPAECTGTKCTVGDLAPAARKAYTFTVQPTAELPATGASFSVSVHDADDKWQETATVTVVPDGKGIDLETAAIPEIKLEAGKSAVLPISVRNNGTQATEGVAIELVGEAVLQFPNQYSNCVRGPESGIVCAFDDSLEPGSVFTLSPSTPLTVSVDKTTAGPAKHSGAVHAFGVTDDSKNAAVTDAAKKALQRPGTKLQLVPATRSLDVDNLDPSELNNWDNSAAIHVKVALNPADSVAIGDNFEGKVGDTRTIKVGIRNDGPALVLSQDSQGKWYQSAKVRIPSGLKLTKVDQNCFANGDGDPSWEHPGQISGHDYLCVTPEYVGVGKQRLFSFTAKIEDGDNEDEGSITVDGGVQDPNAGNNVAKIEVKVTESGGSGGGLPITGAPAGQTALAGLLLMLAGGLALALTRHRPTV